MTVDVTYDGLIDKGGLGLICDAGVYLSGCKLFRIKWILK